MSFPSTRPHGLQALVMFLFPYSSASLGYCAKSRDTCLSLDLHGAVVFMERQCYKKKKKSKPRKVQKHKNTLLAKISWNDKISLKHFFFLWYTWFWENLASLGGLAFNAAHLNTVSFWRLDCTAVRLITLLFLLHLGIDNQLPLKLPRKLLEQEINNVWIFRCHQTKVNYSAIKQKAET